MFEKARVCCPSLTTIQVFTAANSGVSAINGEPPWTQLRHVSLEVTFPYLLFSPRNGGPAADKEDPDKIQYYNSRTWSSTCETLGQVKTLRSLRIGMYARDYRDMHPSWPDRPGRKLWETLVEPLLVLERCPDFVVEVSWPVAEDENERGWPFVVQRRSAVVQSEALEGTASDDDATSSAPNSWNA